MLDICEEENARPPRSRGRSQRNEEIGRLSADNELEGENVDENREFNTHRRMADFHIELHMFDFANGRIHMKCDSHILIEIFNLSEKENE